MGNLIPLCLGCHCKAGVSTVMRTLPFAAEGHQRRRRGRPKTCVETARVRKSICFSISARSAAVFFARCINQKQLITITDNETIGVTFQRASNDCVAICDHTPPSAAVERSDRAFQPEFSIALHRILTSAPRNGLMFVLPAMTDATQQ